jgi:hypothetical protein
MAASPGSEVVIVWAGMSMRTSSADISDSGAKAKGTPSADFHEICGAIHIHTTYSDGSASFPRLILTAQDLGLDYVVATDHMSLGGREYQGFHGKLLVLTGYEHNDGRNLNHYLALDTPRVFKEFDRAQDYVKAVRASGGVGIIAHPFEKRNYFETLPPFPWTAWESDEFDAIEIWNQISDWVEKLKTLFSFIRFLYPRRFLAGVYPETLRKWDELNLDRFVAGVGGVDAHTRRVKIAFVTVEVFPLKVELKGVRTHLYLDHAPDRREPDRARSALLTALKDGRGFVSNFRWGDARGAVFTLTGAGGEVHLPGRCDRIPELPALVTVRIPLPGVIHLVRNGQPIESSSGTHARFTVSSPGIYRVEVSRKRHAWIYSNPFPICSYPAA